MLKSSQVCKSTKTEDTHFSLASKDVTKALFFIAAEEGLVLVYQQQKQQGLVIILKCDQKTESNNFF